MSLIGVRVLMESDQPAEAVALQAKVGPRFQISSLSSESMEQDPSSASGVEIAIGARFPEPWLAAATSLKHVILPFAGVPRRLRAALATVPQVALYNSHYNAGFTAEHAWALLLAAAKRLVPADQRFRRNDWTDRYHGEPSFSLRGKTLLLVGYGAIGQELGRFGRAFGMRVWAVRRTAGAAPELDRLGTTDDLPELLPQVDVVMLSLPETERTTGLIDAAAFSRMKTGVLLVNVGRGTAIDEAAFHEAMLSGRIGAAGIDTWWSYPASDAEVTSTAPSSHSFAQFENLVMSPHRASHVSDHDDAQLAEVATILHRIADGRPPRPVDRGEWY